MKIAITHIKHAGAGGIEKYLNNISSYLADRGHEVSIICRRHEEPHHPKITFIKLRPLSLGPAHRIWTFAKAVDKHLAENHYDVVYGLGKTYTQDVIRLGFGLHSTYIQQAAKFSRSPLEVMLGRDWLVNKVELAIERKAFASKQLKAVVTNSQWVKDDVIRQYNFPEEKIHVIYNGVDLERFSPLNRTTLREPVRAELGIDSNALVALFLGTNYGRKGLDRVIKAMPQVVKQYPELQVLVVGYGSRIEEFKQIAEKNSVASHLKFVGGRRDIEAMYAASDIFVLPTRFDPFANTTIEALASGLPAITTKENGASEIITQHVDGSVLEDSDNSENMAEELIFWLGRVSSEGLIDAARQKAEQHDINNKMKQASELLVSLEK